MRITEIHLDRYGPLSRTSVEPSPGVQVLYGPNEAGKTLFLEAVLRLVEPAVTGAMPPVERVEEEPAGYVRGIAGGEELHLDGSDSLFSDSEVEPTHLANIFVVRESNLSLLSDEHSFYSSLTEHIGVLHTSALDEIEKELILRGRLTKKEKNLSSAEDRDHAADVRRNAASLAEDLESYVEDASEDGVDELEGQLVDVRAELDKTRAEVEALDRAEALSHHERLSNRLEAYREAAGALRELDSFSRDSLETLLSTRNAVEKEQKRISGWRQEIDRHEEEVEKLERRLEEKQDELAPLEDRESDVDELADRLEKFREDGRPGGALKDGERVALRAGGGALGGGALLQVTSVAFGLGVDTVALVLVLLGAAALVAYAVLRYRRRDREDEERRLASHAARAGLEAERPRQIASSVRRFRSKLDGIRERIDELESKVEDRRTRIETLESNVEDSRGEIEEHEEEIERLLETADVGSVKEYRERLEEKEELKTRRETAKQSLVDALGETEAEDWRERTEAWQRELDELVEGVRAEADPGDYDARAHEEKRNKLEQLEDREDKLATRLEEHRERIERFERRLRDDVVAEPFLGSRLELEARTVDGLSRLIQDLRELVRRIERDADVSRLALRVVDDVRAAEESKITDLFAADGPATETFRRISGERYREVRYDPDAETLLVTDDRGRELGPEQLSKGARDQLYLAARVGLAHRLLGGDRGFFVLDDPLVAADRERLEAAFEVLLSLAEEGWQILYFTAKDEVREGMVEKFSLPLATFDGRL